MISERLSAKARHALAMVLVDGDTAPVGDMRTRILESYGEEVLRELGQLFLVEGGGQGVLRTKEAIERQVLRDYAALVGRVVFCSAVKCYTERGDTREIFLVPPAVMRVLPTSKEKSDLIDWMDEMNCDPKYDLELLEPHPALEGLGGFWCYAKSYSLEGTTSPADIWLASGHPLPPRDK